MSASSRQLLNRSLTEAALPRQNCRQTANRRLSLSFKWRQHLSRTLNSQFQVQEMQKWDSVTVFKTAEGQWGPIVGSVKAGASEADVDTELVQDYRDRPAEEISVLVVGCTGYIGKFVVWL